MNCFLCLVALLGFVQLGSAGSPKQMLGRSARPQAAMFRSPFRYIIGFNQVADPSDSDGGRRFVEVLIDEAAFGEDNLKDLFTLVSHRYPTPKTMYIDVFTSLEDISTPEESEQPGMSEIRNQRKPSRHPGAACIRSPGHAVIRYHYWTPRGEQNREIVLTIDENGLIR